MRNDLTYSMFIYGHVININNKYINFSEVDGVELTAELKPRSYSMTDFAKEVGRALNKAGANAYTVTIDRATRLITISSDANFKLLTASGSQIGSSPFDLMGFDKTQDTLSSSSHTASNATGIVYAPQAPLFNYTPFKHHFGANEGAVSTSASGRSSVVSIGTIERMTCNITCITNIEQPTSSGIRSNPNGENNALEFLNYLIQLRPIEFIEDIKNPNEFYKCKLESTKESKQGIMARLYKGSNGKKIQGYYETKDLTFVSIK